MTVQAKFYVSEVRQTKGYDQRATRYGYVTLSPVYGPGNETWSEATPQGKIEMTITNPYAIDQFEPGMEFTVDFTRVKR